MNRLDLLKNFVVLFALAACASIRAQQPATAPTPPYRYAQPYTFSVIARTGQAIGDLTIKNFVSYDGFYVVLNNKGQAAFVAETSKGAAIFRYTPATQQSGERLEVVARVGEVRDKRQIVDVDSPSIDIEGHIAYTVTYRSDGIVEADPSIDHLVRTLGEKFLNWKKIPTEAEQSKAQSALNQAVATAQAKRKMIATLAVDKRTIFVFKDKIDLTKEAPFVPYYDGQGRLIVPILKLDPAQKAAPVLYSALVDGKRDDAYAKRLKSFDGQILRWFYNDKGQVLTGGELTNGVGLPKGQLLAESGHVFGLNQNGKVFADVTKGLVIFDYADFAKSSPSEIYSGRISGSHFLFSEGNNPTDEAGYPDLQKTLGLPKGKGFVIIGALNDAGNHTISTPHLARHSKGYGGDINDKLQVAFPVRYYRNYDVFSSREQQSEQAIILGTSVNLSLTKATTQDAQTVTVDYTIITPKSSEVSLPIHFDIYRSPVPDVALMKQKIGSQDITTQDTDIAGENALSAGSHRIKLETKNGLPPDTANPYVVVVATCNGEKRTIYFRKWTLGVISHGYDRTAPGGPLGGTNVETPAWELTMATNLKNKGKNGSGYDDVIPFNWMAMCAMKPKDGQEKPKLIQLAGADCAAKVLEWRTNHLEKHEGDVVDIHLIGHSRGTVVVTQALKVITDTLPNYGGGNIKITLLDPHPANNDYGEWDDYQHDRLGLGSLAHDAARDFQQAVQDPKVELPVKPNKAITVDIYFQHTKTSELSLVPDQESYLNLYGMISAIDNPAGFSLTTLDLTSKKLGANGGTIGHNEMPQYYEYNIVDLGLLSKWK